MATCNCCGCTIASDYGTSIVTGSGTGSDPFVISIVDTSWIRPSARVRRTTNQSIAPSGTFNAITFDTEVFDTGNLWAVGTPTLFTIQESGIYLFGACGQWAANAVGTRELAFRLNGATVLQVNDHVTPPSGAGSTATPHQTVTYQYRLVPGDTLELLARQESGGALNLLAEADDSIVFWIVYAGKTV